MSCACPLYPWLTGGPTYANFSYPDTADEQLSQVDVDKVDQVVEQLQVTGNTIGQTASNSQGIVFELRANQDLLCC